MPHRVVVTGIGMVSPLGLDVETSWKALLAGESGVGPITSFDPSRLDTKIAASVKDFDPTKYLNLKEARRADRFVQFACASAVQAVQSSGLKIDSSNANEIGVLIGSGIGGIMTLSQGFDTMFTKGPKRMSPFVVPMMITDMGSGFVSILTGAKGPNFCTTSACSSGADALGTAYNFIHSGEAIAMLAGGAEAPICPISIAGFNAAGALSVNNEDPKGASRPFDAKRDGFVMGEGSAILILEDSEHAMNRGAKIIAEMVGYGATGDAYHITQPAEGGEGGARAMKKALDKAGLAPTEIDYINAHGTSTQINDRGETQAIKSVFGEAAYKIPISSTKSMIGHLLGAAGAVEAVISALTIQHGQIPPTINLHNPDPDCDLDYIPSTSRTKKVRAVLSNSFGFGGHNSCLIFKEFVP